MINHEKHERTKAAKHTKDTKDTKDTKEECRWFRACCGFVANGLVLNG